MSGEPRPTLRSSSSFLLHMEAALRAILAAWDADIGGNALRSAPALVEAIAQARELVGK